MVTALIAASSLAVAGCTKADHDLPSLGGTQAGAVEASLEDIAKKYYDCMSADQIPMEIVKNNKGEMVVVQIKGQGHDVLQSYGGDGGGMTMHADGWVWSEAGQQAENDFFDQAGDKPALEFDGVDHSEAFARCLSESGYNDNEAWGSFVPDPADMQRQVTANNKWAACVRDHGWPDVKDSVMPATMDANAWPESITLPGTMTEDQVRQLITACPNFDADQMTEVKDWFKDNPASTSIPDDYLPAPMIQFDIPGLNKTPDPDWTPSPEEQATMDRVSKLYDVLSKASNDYYETDRSENLDGGGAAASDAPAGQ
jgi:hypothetical protein